jgi:rfaE bifunctional protein nucleotidyltransferase chain/domain
MHALLIHSLCRGIEEELFPRPPARPDQTDEPASSPAMVKARPGLPAGKLISSSELATFALALTPYRSVFTNGCFDVLHPGHVALLRAARNLGDLLVVGLNSDASVRRLKGPTRPYHTFADRAAVLAALEAVDFVIGFDEDTPLELIRRLTPKVLVKGGDYTRATIVGADWVESHGGTVQVFPLVGHHSTTAILQKSS